MTELGGNLFLLLCVSVSLWLFLLGALNASRQLRDYLSVLLLCEGAHRLGAHAAVRGCGQNHARHRLVVGRFGDGDGVVFLQLWRQSPIHAIRLNGEGKPPEPLWISKLPGPVEPSLLYYRGLLYVWLDNGTKIGSGITYSYAVSAGSNHSIQLKVFDPAGLEGDSATKSIHVS